jgi:hypothetical protein
MRTDRGKLSTLVIPAVVLLWSLLSCTVPQTPASQPGAGKSTADLQTAIAVIQTATEQARLAATGGAPLLALTVEIAPPIATAPPAGCVDNAAFVGDVTVPDNSVFNPGDRFDKTWRIRNSGTCTWGAGYRLIFVSGNIMGAQSTAGVALTDPGSSADLTVAMTAPAGPGIYSGTWQLTNAGGQRFGPKYTVIIQVSAPSPPTVTLTVPPIPTNTAPPPPLPAKIEITADETALKAGECTYIRAYVEGVSSAWLDGTPVVGGYQEKKACPCASTTYELKADLMNGEHRTRTVKIDVTGFCLKPIMPLVTIAKPLLPMPLVTLGP